MAPNVVDAGVLKHNIVSLLLKYPQGIKFGDFSGAFYKLHGHHPQLALHGYSSLMSLLAEMKNVVVLEKESQETVIKLASNVLFHQWLDEEEAWDNFEERWYSSEGEMQRQTNEEAEDEADSYGPATFLDTAFSAGSLLPQKMRGNESVLAAAVVPVLGVLQDYPEGLRLQTLMENVQKRGFDLERFSQDMGYSDVMFCLLDMPGLHFIFLNGMEPQNCVVQLLSSRSGLPAWPLDAGSSLHKPLTSSATGIFPQHLRETKQASHSSTTSQASASLCRNLDLSTSSSKTLNQNMLRKKPGNLTAPAEVLAWLTNLLKNYPKGLKVKKLQELLWTMKGFDLEKFSIARGYKDTLGFLEHQMPKLEISYHESRCKCVVKRGKMKKQKKTLNGQEKMTKCPAVKVGPPLPSVQAQVEPTKPDTAPALAEVLASLTNFLKSRSYKSGLRVKKLDELFLTEKGLDLEKFSIAQGYKDTLEFLKHHMPHLKITYSENRFKCVVKQGPDVEVSAPLPNVQAQGESTKKVEPPSVAQDFGGISHLSFAEVTKAGLGVAAPLQNGLRSSVPVPSTVMPNHPSSKERNDASSGKDESSSQPHSDVPARQSSAGQFSGPSEESSDPTDARMLSQPSLTKPSPPEHLDELKQQVACIIAKHPEGMSLFQFRAAYSATYQYHLPLGNATSAKQRLLEMSDILFLKGYGVQTLILPVSPEEPSTNPGPPTCSGVGNALLLLADSLPKAVVEPEPAVGSKSSILKTPMAPQPRATRPPASDLLRAPDIQENRVLPMGQSLTTPSMVAPLDEAEWPKISFGAHPDSSEVEETCLKENSFLPKGQYPATPKVVAPSQEPVRPKVNLGGHLGTAKAEVSAKNLVNSLTKAAVKTEPVVVSRSSILKTPVTPQPRATRPLASDLLRAPDVKENHVLHTGQSVTTPSVVAPLHEAVRPKISFGAHLDSSEAEETCIKENSVLPKGKYPATPKVVAPSQEPVRPKVNLGGHLGTSKAEVAPKNLLNSPTKAGVKTEPVVVPKSSCKPSISSTAVPMPQLYPSVPSTSACLRSPGNKESSFLPQSLPPRPPVPSIPVGMNVTARVMPGDNLFVPQFPVAFPEEPQVSRLNGVWTSDSFASRPMYLANPSFSVNIPVPSLFQPVLANIAGVSQPVVYPPLRHLPDIPADPSLCSALHPSVSRTQLQKTGLVNSRLAQPPSQNIPAKLTSPVPFIEQADCTHMADGLDPFQSASRTQGRGHSSQAPSFSADGHPVSSHSGKPPSCQPFKSPSVKQPGSVHRTLLSSMPCSSVPVADGSGVASRSTAGVYSEPVEPACQKQNDAANAPAVSPGTTSPIASHQPFSPSYRSCTESATAPSEPLGSTPEPSTLLNSSPGSSTSAASQPSYVSLNSNTGHDASRQSQPLPGISREGPGQDSHHFTLPDNQNYRLKEQSAQPPQNKMSDKCVIL